MRRCEEEERGKEGEVGLVAAGAKEAAVDTCSYWRQRSFTGSSIKVGVRAWDLVRCDSPAVRRIIVMIAFLSFARRAR